jgi:hypothetical protein
MFAHKQDLTLRPKSMKTQFFRALLAGFALTLFSMSYNWLTASTVSVLSNIDVPLLVVLGPLVGIKASLRTRIFSLISISFLLWYVLGLEFQLHLFYGLTSLMSACLLLCFGYYYIQKSMKEENPAITIMVPSLAIIFYGLLQKAGISTVASTWSPELILLDILSGMAMFSAYIATMKLYKLTDLASAEFPTLIPSLVIQPVEAIILNVPMQANYILPSLGFVIMTYFILTSQHKASHV